MKRLNSLKPLIGFDFEEGDFCEVVFSHRKTAMACRCFIEWLKSKGDSASRGEVSSFSRSLANGAIREGFRYRRENFYRTVLRRLLDLGFLSLQPHFDPKRKSKVSYRYAPVRQPIPKKPPLGGETFWRKTWFLCKKWNQQFEEG